ncbi:MAG: cytidylate kinase-like family protein [Clostridiales bacterium]|nr:cytidylate kinase-like family protein [Clostridiales bacterium]
MNTNLIITIGRQYGSGGREIGEKLAKKLGIEFYNNELITLAAQKSGMAHAVLNEADEKATNSLLYTLAMGSSFFSGNAGMTFDMPINDKLFVTQSEIIKNLADEKSAVFIGRCSDYVLRNYPNLLRLFIHAPLDFRTAHIAERHDITLDKAKELAIKTDKRRANYYNYYTGQKWGRIDNCDIAIDSSRLGIDGTVETLAGYIEAYREIKK